MDDTKYLTRRKGITALIALALVYACMGLFVRYLNTGFELVQQVYLRIFAAAICSFLVFRKDISLSKFTKLPKREWFLLFIRAFFMYCLGVILFTKAILLTKYSNVSFIGSIPAVAIFGFLLFKEKITTKKIALILLSFIGVILISVSDYSSLFSWGTGEIIALISTIAFAFSYIARKWQGKFLNNKEITFATIVIGFFLLFISSISLGEGLPINNWTAPLLGVVVLAGMFNVANSFLTNYGFEHVDNVLASNILTLESFFAIMLGIIFFQEIPSFKEFIGGILIIISVVGMNSLEEKS